MTYHRRLPIAAVAASICLNLLACNTDEPATFLPRSGTWSYNEDSVVSNSCAGLLDTVTRSPTFTLDFDGGDSFQIELGSEDAMCEIDGADFNCADYPLDSVDVPAFMVTLNLVARWEGEFTSETLATGHETIAVTCVGENCTMADTLPCSRQNTFTAEFVN